jgi:hypothetical protein
MPAFPHPSLPASATSPDAITSYDRRTPADAPDTLAEDLLEGAESIALYMFGTVTAIRQVYRLSTEVDPEHRPPFFKLGRNTLAARKSALLRWITEREKAHQNA